MRHSSVNYLEVLTAQQTLLTNLQKFFRHLRNTTQNRQSNEAGHQLGWSVSLYICKERAHDCACVAHIYSPDLYLYPATQRCRFFLFYCLPLQGDAQYPVSTWFVKMTKREVAWGMCLNDVWYWISQMTKRGVSAPLNPSAIFLKKQVFFRRYSLTLRQPPCKKGEYNKNSKESRWQKFIKVSTELVT